MKPVVRVQHVHKTYTRENGPIEVNQKIAFLGQKFGNLENEISGRVGNWKLKTWVLKPKKNNWEKVQKFGFDSLALYKTKLTISNCWEKTEIDAIVEKNPKLIQEVNLRFETRIYIFGSRSKKNDPEIDKRNFWSTLIGPMQWWFRQKDQ